MAKKRKRSASRAKITGPYSLLNREVPPYWTTKQGEVIPIERMDDDHLLNVIGYLEREAAIRRFLLPSDFPSYSVERWASDSFGKYDQLVEEAKKRTLIP